MLTPRNTLKKRLLTVFLAIALLGSAYLAFDWWRVDRIVVAVDAPSTLQTVFDPSDQAAARLYVEENRNSKIEFTPLYYDLKPENSAPGFVSAKRNGIRFFVTTQPSSTLVASQHLFGSDDALLINTSATSPLLTGKDDSILRLIPDGAHEQRQIADHIQKLPGKRLLVLQDVSNAAYTEPAFASFSEHLASSGRWTITREKLDVSKFNTHSLADLFGQSFDALYVLAGDFHPSIGNLVQLFHRTHPNAPIILTPWARSPAIYETAGDALPKIVLLSHLPSRKDDPKMADYFRRFEERFGYPPSAMAFKIRAALEILEQAFSAGHTTPASVKKYLLEQGKLETSLFPVTFDSNGDSTMTLQPITDLGHELRPQ